MVSLFRQFQNDPARGGQGDAMQYFLDTIETIPEGQGFSSFGPVHLAWLAGFVVFAIACSLFYRNSSQARRKHIRWLFAALLLADEAFKIVCLLVGGNYRASYLPLHMCCINIFLIALHALRPTRLVDNFLYAVCIPAALAALLFPTWVSLPPANFMHLHSFTVHILLATYPIMLTAGRDIRPQAKYLPGCVGLALALAVPVYCINLALGTNFMFLMRADAGNPLRLFEQAFGNHLLGYPVLAGAIFAVMYGLPCCQKRLRARLARRIR